MCVCVLCVLCVSCGGASYKHTRARTNTPQGDLFHFKGQISETEVKSIMLQLLQARPRPGRLAAGAPQGATHHPPTTLTRHHQTHATPCLPTFGPPTHPA